MGRSDSDGDDKARQKREEREEEPQEELEEGLDLARLVGNAFRAAAGSGSVGATIDLTGPKRGDPGDTDDPGASAAPPPDEPEAVVDTLGDPDWSPPPRPAGPRITPRRRVAGPDLANARLDVAEQRVEAVQPGVDAWRVPTGDLVATALSAWTATARRLSGDDAVAARLAWWAARGAHAHSPAPTEAGPLIGAALASLAWSRHSPEDDPGLALRLALEAGRTRLEAAEHHWALGGGGIPSAVQLLGDRVVAVDLPPVPAEPGPHEAAAHYWSEALTLRSGRIWRATHTGPDDADPDDPVVRLIGPGAVEPAARRREHAAELGIGLFRELVRHRLRVAAAALVLYDAAAPLAACDLAPALHALARQVDEVTGDALATLHRLGRGLHLSPYIDEATAHAMIDLVAGAADRAAARWARRLAELTAAALGGADLPELPRGPTLPAALLQGRPDRLPDLDPVADALRPPLRPSALRAAADEGPTGAALELLALVALGDDPEAAARQARVVADVAESRGNAALTAAAAWLGADAAWRTGHDPEPGILVACARLLALGEGPWAELLATWAPPAPS